jgi:hypothetical protein
VHADEMPSIPPIEWFQDPQLPELTPLTVDTDGRVTGHLCGWGKAHRGLSGRITPPRSRTDYSEFLLHACRVQDGDEVRTVAVGNLTMGTGHASMSANLRQAVEHYDNTGSIVAQVAVGEDAHGVWFSGAVLPDVDEVTIRRFMSSGTSGDWRSLDGSNGLELCAVLACPVPGFSAPRARVASGAPLALVAAGAVMPAQSFGKAVNPAWVKPAVAARIVSGKLSPGVSGARVEIGADGSVKWFSVSGEQVVPATAPSPATLAAQIDRALEQRERKATLAAKRAALLAEVDDAPRRHAALVASLDDTGERKARLLAELGDDEDAFDVSKMPPQLKEEWLHGKVAARIAWGTDGDFDRCVVQAKAHGIPARQQDGLCSNLHREATGGKNPGEHGATS